MFKLNENKNWGLRQWTITSDVPWNCRWTDESWATRNTFAGDYDDGREVEVEYKGEKYLVVLGEYLHREKCWCIAVDAMRGTDNWFKEIGKEPPYSKFFALEK